MTSLRTKSRKTKRSNLSSIAIVVSVVRKYLFTNLYHLNQTKIDLFTTFMHYCCCQETIILRDLVSIMFD